jgi:hypothetical protein
MVDYLVRKYAMERIELDEARSVEMSEEQVVHTFAYVVERATSDAPQISPNPGSGAANWFFFDRGWSRSPIRVFDYP